MATGIFSTSKSGNPAPNNGQVVDQRKGSNSCEFVEHPDSRRLDVNKIMSIMSRLKYLTLPYCDSEGYSLQLWKMDSSVLIGTAQNGHGEIIIVPAEKIRALSTKNDASFIIRQLEQAPTKHWHIAFNPQSKEMDLWPFLIAAGKDKWTIEVEKSPYKNMTKEQVVEKLRQDGFVKSRENTESDYINHQTGEKARIDSRHQGRYGEPNHVDYTASGKEKPTRLYYKDPYGLHQFRLQHPKPNKNHPSGGFSLKNPNMTPAQRHFEQLVQQKKLTGSYPGNIPAKGSGGQIGGIACSTEYIKGLFDTPESMFEGDHFFCMPKLPDGSMPFTDLELRQILRELAIGIYTHGTLPFFSLHFNQKGDLVPVIHPVYANTLVGRVISMLDYIMKGYLNGGTYREEFVDQWHQDPNWKHKEGSAWQQLIDFETYYHEHLEGNDKSYLSLRQVQEVMRLQKGIVEEGLDRLDQALGIDTSAESPILSNFTGFSNSFRIIAKQNSIQKEDNLFLIDADFDVFYTINPSPEYQEALDQHLRKHGTLPTSYQNMISAYECIKEAIHDHMVKAPLCRNYFAMLSVISFFSSYFSTLKKHRKIPVLPAFEMQNTPTSATMGCPTLFPHLPVKATAAEHLQYNLREVLKVVENNKTLHTQLCRLFLDTFESKYPISLDPVKQTWEELLLSPLQAIFEKNILSSCSLRARQAVSRGNRSIREHIKETSREMAKLIGDRIFGLLCEVDRHCKDGYATKLRSLHGPQKMQEKVTEILSNLLSILIKKCPDEKKNISTAPMVYSYTRLQSEIKLEEVEQGKKIVGGCGLNLKVQTVKSSPKAAEIMEEHWAKMISLPPESWYDLGQNGVGSGQALFRLFLEDVPSGINDDYAWMESLLLVPKEEEPERMHERVSLQEAMFSGDRETFLSLINKVADVDGLRDRYQRTVMHHAATLEDPFYLQCLLDLGSLFYEDVYGYLPIHYAAMTSSKTLPLLLEQDEDKETLNERSRNGSSPLMVAIEHNQLQAVQLLLSQGAAYSSAVEGYNVLHAAMHQGNLEVINALLCDKQTTADCLNELSEEEGTPLMLACELDAPNLIQRMIEMGADPSIKRKDGVTAIEIVIRRNCLPVLTVLLASAIPTDRAIDTLAKEGSLEIVTCMAKKSYLFGKGKNLYFHRNSYKDTPLHSAIRYGNAVVAKFLIQNFNGTSFVNAKNLGGETACGMACSAGLWEIIEKLVKKNATPPLNLLLKAPYHPLLKQIFQTAKLTESTLQSYLLIAAQAGNYQAITEILIPKGAKIDQLTGPKNWKMIHYLAKCDGLDLFRQLLSQQRDLLQPLQEEGNKTLGFIAAENGSRRILRLLLELMKKENCSLHSHYRDKHLFYAIIEAGHVDELLMILDIFQEKSLIDEILDNKKTRPVHLAARMASIDILEVLCDRGANLHVRDAHGLTPLDYAVRTGSKKLISYLLKRDPSLSVTKETISLATSQAAGPMLLELLTPCKGFVIAPEQTTPKQEVKQSDEKKTLKFLQALQGIDQEEMEAAINDLPLNEPIAMEHEGRQIWAAPLQLLLRIDRGKKFAPLVCELLKRKELNTELVDSYGDTLAHLLVAANINPSAYPDLLTRKNHRGQTPLHLAAQYGEVKLVSLLLNHLEVKQWEATDHQGKTALFYAIEGKKEDNLRLLIEKGADLHHYDHHLMTPLLYTCKERALSMAKILLQSGANPNQVGMIDRLAPLHIAIATQDETDEMAYCLIFHGANCDLMSAGGNHPVHIAAAKGKNQLLRLFAAKGVSLQVKNRQGMQAIHMAAMGGKTATIETLLANTYASIETVVESDDPSDFMNGATPLHLAALSGQRETVQYLLDNHANPEKTTHTEMDALGWAVSNATTSTLEPLFNLPVSQHPKHLLLALVRAIVHDNVDAMTLLYERGITIHSDLSNGFTGLHLACQYGALQCTEWLLQQGADPLAVCSTGENALELAAVNKSYEQFHLLLDYVQVDLDQVNNRGETLLHLCARKGSLHHLVVLMTLGADLSKTNAKGYSALYIAVEAGHSQLVRLLLLCGTATSIDGKYAADLVQKDDQETTQVFQEFETFRKLAKHGEPLLHTAIRSGHFLAVLVLTQTTDIDEQDPDGISALHLSVQLGQIACIKHLIDAAAAVNPQDALGRTPLWYACNHQDKLSIAEALMHVGADPSIQDRSGCSIVQKVQQEDLPKKEELLIILQITRPASIEKTFKNAKSKKSKSELDGGYIPKEKPKISATQNLLMALSEGKKLLPSPSTQAGLEKSEIIEQTVETIDAEYATNFSKYTAGYQRAEQADRAARGNLRDKLPSTVMTAMVGGAAIGMGGSQIGGRIATPIGAVVGALIGGITGLATAAWEAYNAIDKKKQFLDAIEGLETERAEQIENQFYTSCAPLVEQLKALEQSGETSKERVKKLEQLYKVHQVMLPGRDLEIDGTDVKQLLAHLKQKFPALTSQRKTIKAAALLSKKTTPLLLSKDATILSVPTKTLGDFSSFKEGKSAAISYLASLPERNRLSMEVYTKAFNFLEKNDGKIHFDENQKKAWIKFIIATTSDPERRIPHHYSLADLRELLEEASTVSARCGEEVLKSFCGAPDLQKPVSFNPLIRILKFLAIFACDLNLVAAVQQHLSHFSSGTTNMIQFLEKLEQLSPDLQEDAIAEEEGIDILFERFAGQDSNVQFPLHEEKRKIIKEHYLSVRKYCQRWKTCRIGTLVNMALEIKEKVVRDQEDLLKLMAIGRLAIRVKFPGIYLHATQVLTTLSLMSGNTGAIAQVKTGEGKSKIIALLAFVLSMQSRKVHIISSSRQLAIRDQAECLDFFKTFRIESSSIAKDDYEPKYFQAEILYGTATDFQFAVMREMLNGISLFPEKRAFDCAIIDEVDNLTIDTALSSARLGAPAEITYDWVYTPIFQFVRDNFKAEDRHKITSKEAVEKLKCLLKEYSHGRFATTVQQLSDKQLKEWLFSAHHALFELQEDEHYIIQKTSSSLPVKQVLIVDAVNTGRILDSSRWSRGIHEFVEVKHGAEAQRESLTPLSLSYPVFYQMYKTLFGLTGTLGSSSEREAIKEIYSMDSFDVPTHQPSQREDKTPTILLTDEMHLEAILQRIRECHQKGRPILVLCETIKFSKIIEASLANSGLAFEMLNAVQKKRENEVIAQAGMPGAITIATNTAARGTDISLKGESARLGGLHVLITFYPQSERVEQQARGRAGRQGQPGSSEILLSAGKLGLSSGFVTPEKIDQILENLLEQRRLREKEMKMIHSCRTEMERYTFP